MGGPCPDKATASGQIRAPAARQHSRPCVSSSSGSHTSFPAAQVGDHANHSHLDHVLQHNGRPKLAKDAAAIRFLNKGDGSFTITDPLTESDRTPATAVLEEPSMSNTSFAEFSLMFQDLGDRFDEHCRDISAMLSLHLEKHHIDLVAEVQKLHAQSVARLPQQQQEQQVPHEKLDQEQNQKQHHQLHIRFLPELVEASSQAPGITDATTATPTTNKVGRQETNTQERSRADTARSEAGMTVTSSMWSDIFSGSRRREKEWIANRIGFFGYILDSHNGGSWKKQRPRRHRSRFESIVEYAWFNHFWHVLILASAALNGYHAHIGMDALLTQEPEPQWINPAELTFSCLFLLELLIRIAILRLDYFCGDDCYWNMFDACVIISTTVADAFDINDFVRLLRGIRIIRLFRAIRGAAVLMPLRLMITCMINCMPSLLWATLVVLLMMYFFAILFMQAAQGYVVIGNVAPPIVEELEQYYRNLPTTMLSLFMAVTGGTDWGDVRRPMAAIHWTWGLCFILYVFFTILGVFNVLIGLFVDRAFDSSKMDKDIVLQAENERTETFMREVKQMFLEMDTDDVGYITKEQFLSAQDDSRMMSYMQMHQLNMIEPTFFFQMLDKDGSNSINLEELIVGMMRFGGQARASDVMTLTVLIRGLREEMKHSSQNTQERLAQLETMTGFSTV